LELDDNLDDFEDSYPKPPSRRPLLIILLLLIVAGGAYVAMNPDMLTSITSMITAPGSQTASDTPPDAGPASHSTPKLNPDAPPSPSFQEGAVVSVVSKPGDLGPMRLSRDAQGTDPGPSVKTGELLTIVDGAFINDSWVYMVHTKSGATGWITEDHIRTPS